MGQMIPEVILKHTLHKLSTTLITYLKVTYLMNSPIYNPESRKYQESLLTRKMGIIQLLKEIGIVLGLDLTLIPFLIEQKAPKTIPPPICSNF